MGSIMRGLALAVALLPLQAFSIAYWYSPPDQSQARQLLVQKLKELANSGSLHDVSKTTQILGFALKLVQEDRPMRCDLPIGRLETTKGTAASSIWYRPLPDGAGSVEYPGNVINPAGRTGPAAISYSRVRHVRCTDAYDLQDSTRTVLTFSGLPSYSCLSRAALGAMIPRGRMEIYTDGGSAFRYDGLVDDDAETSLTFSFRDGAECAVSAEVERDEMRGLRYARANAIYRNCAAKTRRDFCAKNGPIQWGDGRTLDRMHEHTNKVCGTLDAIAKADRQRGTPPVALPRMRPIGALPCDLYEVQDGSP